MSSKNGPGAAFATAFEKEVHHRMHNEKLEKVTKFGDLSTYRIRIHTYSSINKFAAHEKPPGVPNRPPRTK